LTPLLGWAMVRAGSEAGARPPADGSHQVAVGDHVDGRHGADVELVLKFYF